MAPPEFNDIGKAVRDLLNKDYNFGKTKLEAKSTTQSGVEFTSSLERNDKDGTLKGEIKTKLKHSDTGLVFTDSYTTGNDLGVKVEAPDLAAGLKLELDTTFNPPTGKKEVKFGTTYKTDAVTTTLAANAFQTPKVKADAVFAHDGFLAGSQLTFDIGTSSLSDYALAVGYTEKDYAVSLHANKKLSQYVATYTHNVSSDVTVAAQASLGSTDKMLFEFGAQYKLDSDSTVKAKVETNGRVSLGFMQKIRPNLKATFGLLVDTRNLNDGAHNFGFGLTFEPK